MAKSEKIDVAIRITHEPPLDKVAKRLGSDRMIICASKEYLEQYGQPKTAKQLREHPCLVYSSERSVDQWPFLEEKTAITIPVESRIFSNSASEAVRKGQGIARLPQFVIEDFLKSGELCALLSDFYPPDIPIYAIFAQSRIIPPKIQVFVQFLEEIHGAT